MSGVDVVEVCREANKIEDVIGEMFPMQRVQGRYLRTQEHDSLVVDVKKQLYTWNSQSEHGDVYEWVMRRNNWDFKTAVEHLCRRASLAEPRWSQESQAQRVATRLRETAFSVALERLHKWLLGDADALAYARGRGWSDETIEECMLGFSGRGTAAELKDMRGQFAMYEIQPECPDAVAVLGYRGDVRAWGQKWTVEVQDNWVEWGLVPGLMGRTRLVYPHMYMGRVRTFSGRNILGAEVNKEGREVKSYNLPVALAGSREVFYNQAYAPRAAECIVVEGQADAVTIGQWRLAAVALAGTSWQDHEALLKELRERHEKLWIGLDGDEAGTKALVGKDGEWPLGKILGPMARVLRWGWLDA